MLQKVSATRERLNIKNQYTLAIATFQQSFDQQVFNKTETQYAALLNELKTLDIELTQSTVTPTLTPKAAIEELHAFMAQFTAIDEVWLAEGYANTYGAKQLQPFVDHIGDTTYNKLKVTIYYDKGKRSVERTAEDIAFSAAEYFKVPEKDIRVKAQFVTFEKNGISYEFEASTDDYRLRDFIGDVVQDKILDSGRRATGIVLKNKLYQILDGLRTKITTQTDARGRSIPWEECLTGRGRISRDMLIQIFNWNQDWKDYMRNVGNEQGNLEPKEDIVQLLREDIRKLQSTATEDTDSKIQALQEKRQNKIAKAEAKGKSLADIQEKLAEIDAELTTLAQIKTTAFPELQKRVADLNILLLLALYYKCEKVITDYEGRADSIVRRYVNIDERQALKVVLRTLKNSPFVTEPLRRFVHRMTLPIAFIALAMTLFGPGIISSIGYYWGKGQEQGKIDAERADIDRSSFDFTKDIVSKNELVGLFGDNWTPIVNKYFSNPTAEDNFNPRADILDVLDKDLLSETDINTKMQLIKFRDAVAKKLELRVPTTIATIDTVLFKSLLGAQYDVLLPKLQDCFIGLMAMSVAAPAATGDMYANAFASSSALNLTQDSSAATASTGITITSDTLAKLVVVYRITQDSEQKKAIESLAQYVQWAFGRKPLINKTTLLSVFGPESMDGILQVNALYNRDTATYTVVPAIMNILAVKNTLASQNLLELLQKKRVALNLDAQSLTVTCGGNAELWKPFVMDLEGQLLVRDTALADLAKARDTAQGQGDSTGARIYTDLLTLVTPVITAADLATVPGTIDSLFIKNEQGVDMFVPRFDFVQRSAQVDQHIVAQIHALIDPQRMGVAHKTFVDSFGSRAQDLLNTYILDPQAQTLTLKALVNLNQDIAQRQLELRQTTGIGQLERERSQRGILADLYLKYPTGIPVRTVQGLDVAVSIIETYFEKQGDVYSIRLDMRRLANDIRDLDKKISDIFNQDQKYTDLQKLKVLFGN